MTALKYSFNEGLNMQTNLQGEGLKTAKFKKIDWDKIEKNFICKGIHTAAGEESFQTRKT